MPDRKPHPFGWPSLVIAAYIMIVTLWVIYRVFGNSPPDIPDGTVKAFAAYFGLPMLAAGVWKGVKTRRESKQDGNTRQD